MRIKPAQGRQVRLPDPPYRVIEDTDIINVPESNYWLRRLVKGDVVLVADAPVETPVSPVKPKSKGKE